MSDIVFYFPLFCTFNNYFRGRQVVNSESRNRIKEKMNTDTNENKTIKYKECIRELDLYKQTFLLRNIEGKKIKQIKCFKRGYDG